MALYSSSFKMLNRLVAAAVVPGRLGLLRRTLCSKHGAEE